MRTVNGTETVLATQVVPGLVMNPTQVINLRLQAIGSGTTTLRAKLWLTGVAEPGWMLTATDTTAALQNAAAVGFYSYLTSSATNAPIRLQVQSFGAQQP